MNNYLLDTHSLLWFQGNSPKLSRAAIEINQNPRNNVSFSQISLYEIAIKLSIGKLPDFKADISTIYQQAIQDRLNFLPIQNSHLYFYKEVPLLSDHRDPFDRLLIAAAYTEMATIISIDKKFDLYSNFIKTIW
jgi:PIN domain nuclease of toxin-antitoxin system